MKVLKEQTFSFSEIAAILGISIQQVILIMKEGGLINENGKPTEFAIKEGYLAGIEIIDFCAN